MKLGNSGKGLLAVGGLLVAGAMTDIACDPMERAWVASRTRGKVTAQVAAFQDRQQKRGNVINYNSDSCEVGRISRRKRLKPFERTAILYYCEDFDIACYWIPRKEDYKCYIMAKGYRPESE